MDFSQNTQLQKDSLTYLADEFVEQGFVLTQQPATADIPFDSLWVVLDSQTMDDVQWQIQVSFLPGLTNQLDEVDILQSFVVIKEGTESNTRNELNSLLVTINTKLPIGSFGYLKEIDSIYFKHNALLANDNDEASADVVMEQTYLINFLLDNFHQIIDDVASGKHTSAKALSNSTFRSLYP